MCNTCTLPPAHAFPHPSEEAQQQPRGDLPASGKAPRLCLALTHRGPLGGGCRTPAAPAAFFLAFSSSPARPSRLLCCHLRYPAAMPAPLLLWGSPLLPHTAYLWPSINLHDLLSGLSVFGLSAPARLCRPLLFANPKECKACYDAIMSKAKKTGRTGVQAVDMTRLPAGPASLCLPLGYRTAD